MPTLHNRPASLQWAFLLLASLVLIIPLELLHLPAAVLLGAMLAGIGLTALEGRLNLPATPFLLAQALVGCLMARSLGPGLLPVLAAQWPLFLAGVVTVILFSVSLGALLARWQVLPGTTAVWGSVPGAATVMVLMADAHGGDMRLVAFMQFLRVVMVATVASLVSRLVAAPGAPLLLTPDWFPPLPVANFALTLAVAAAGVLIGIKGRIPAGALIVPLFAGTALSGSGLVQFMLPPWLMVGCYVLLGWGIGLRFTRAVAVYAARRLPQVALSVLVLIGLCGGLGYLLHRLAGIDLLTAYLATSPGGADSVAIIATASAVDVPFVMAMQSARFLLILFTGPSLARVVARWMQQPR